MLVDHHDAESVESVTDHYGVLRTPCLSSNSQALHQHSWIQRIPSLMRFALGHGEMRQSLTGLQIHRGNTGSKAATHQRNYLRSHYNSPIGMVLEWPQDSYHPALHGYW